MASRSACRGFGRMGETKMTFRPAKSHFGRIGKLLAVIARNPKNTFEQQPHSTASTKGAT